MIGKKKVAKALGVKKIIQKETIAKARKKKVIEGAYWLRQKRDDHPSQTKRNHQIRGKGNHLIKEGDCPSHE